MAATAEEKYHELNEDSVEIIQEAIDKMYKPFNVNFQLLGNAKQKKLLEVSKVPDQYAFITKQHVLISVNEAYLDAFDEESRAILIQQELDRLQFDTKTGKIKRGAPEISTSVGVVKKYGIDAVARANKLMELYEQQLKDAKGDKVDANGLTEVGSVKDDGAGWLN